MIICMTGTEARLEGDWTLTGVTRNIDALAQSLQQLEPERKKDLQIDCGLLKIADINGLQLLKVWLQCARHRGMEPILVNVPEKLKHTMQVMMGPYCTEIYSSAAMLPELTQA